MHICGDEIGIIGFAVAAVGSFIKPVRDCVKCYAIMAWKAYADRYKGTSFRGR